MKPMTVGIIGCGVVGTALKNGFKLLEHEVFIADPKIGTSEIDVLDTDVSFICVPTNSNKDGSCDISIVEEVISNLIRLRYKGVVVLKSTVPPGTTTKLSRDFSQEIAFVPEFLRERCATEDFINNQDLLVVGTDNRRYSDTIIKVHGDLPKRTIICSQSEAEAVKYFNNIHNAVLVTFANSFYEVCSDLGIDYDRVKDIATLRDHIHNSYLNCDIHTRGFGGPCLPKDTKAITHLVKTRKLDIEFFDMILAENAKYKTTVFRGMRQ